MTSSPSRIPWMDHMRMLACILVIMAHIVVPYFMRPPLLMESSSFQWSSFYAVLVRVAVPLFFMISGALILPVRYSTKEFLSKRFSRVLCPFLIWSVLYAAFPWIYQTLTGGDFKVLFPYSRALPDLDTMWNNIFLIPVNFSVGIHLWFIYVLLGLYVFAPIISPWVEKAGKTQFHYFLAIWIFTLFLPYLRVPFPRMAGECSWNDYAGFYYFSGYLGYMLLGVYFRRFYSLSFRQTVAWALPAFALGLWFTLHFYRLTTLETQAPNGAYISFVSINVAVMSASVFAFVQTLPGRIFSGWQDKAITEFSEKSFGVFLVHFFLVGILYNSFQWLELTAFLKIPLLTILTCLIGYIVIKIISFLPGGRYITG